MFRKKRPPKKKQPKLKIWYGESGWAYQTEVGDGDDLKMLKKILMEDDDEWVIIYGMYIKRKDLNSFRFFSE